MCSLHQRFVQDKQETSLLVTYAYIPKVCGPDVPKGSSYQRFHYRIRTAQKPRIVLAGNLNVRVASIGPNEDPVESFKSTPQSLTVSVHRQL